MAWSIKVPESSQHRTVNTAGSSLELPSSTVRIRVVISLHPYSICVSSPLSLIDCEDLDLVIYGIKHNRTVILKKLQ